MSVTTRVSDDGRHVTIFVSGNFDASLYGPFKSAYLDTADTCQAYDVDLSGVSFMSSAGLGMLILLKESASSHDATIRIVNPSFGAKQNLEMAFFHEFFEIVLD